MVDITKVKLNPEVIKTINNYKERKSRKTFATITLHKLTNRIYYYRQTLNRNITDKHRNSILIKYERDLKIRSLLNRAISHLYK